MSKKTVSLVIAAVLFLAFMVSLPVNSVASSAPRITPEVLKALLGNPEVVVLDVRRGNHWEGSDTKILSAVRESEKDVFWAGKYDKDKIIVLYCA